MTKEYEIMSTEEKLQLAKLSLLANKPFFAALALRMQMDIFPHIKSFFPESMDYLKDKISKDALIKAITDKVKNKMPDIEDNEKSKGKSEEEIILEKILKELTGSSKEEFKTILLVLGKTMGVDMLGHAYYNPVFIEDLEREQLETVLCHEIMHLVFQHALRSIPLLKDNRINISNEDKLLILNIIEDAIINDILIHQENMVKPMDGLILPDKNGVQTFNFNGKKHKFLVRDKSVEEIWDKIIRTLDKDGLPQNPNGSSGSSASESSDEDESEGNGGSGNKITAEDEYGNTQKGFDKHDHPDPNTMTAKQQEQLQNSADKWKDATAAAAVSAKQQGKGSSWMERLVEELVAPKINWRTVLSSFIQNTILSNYSYTRPAKKSISLGFYNPMIIKKPERLIVAVDVSGSIGQEELSIFLSEVKGITDAHPNLDIRLLYWSTQVDDKNDLIFNSNNLLDALDIHPNSTGGTEISCVEDYLVEDNSANAAGIVYLTDGYVEAYPRFEADNLKRLFVYTESEEVLQNYPEKGSCLKLDIKD